MKEPPSTKTKTSMILTWIVKTSLSLNISEGKCISAKLKRELSCIACNACIKGIASDDMITCQNCQMTTLEENCSHKLVAQLMILTAKGKVQSYTCFNDALQSFLASSNTNLTIDTIDLDELKKTAANISCQANDYR